MGRQEPFLNRSEFDDEVFESLECRDAVLEGKEFQGCSFVGCQLSGSRFLRCKFIDCVFRSCDLSNVVVKGCTFRDVTAEDSKLLGINWSEAVSTIHLSFHRCAVSLGNFGGMNLRKGTFSACVAREVEFGHANLSESDCRGTDFAGSRFFHTDLTKSDFRQALNYAIRPGDNTLKNAKFSLPEATSLLYGLDIILDS